MRACCARRVDQVILLVHERPNSDICLALFDRFDDAFCPGIDDHDLHAREITLERSKHVGYQHLDEQRGPGDSEPPPMALAQRMRVIDRMLQIGERLLRMSKEFATGRRQFHPPRRPVEETGGELVLQPSHQHRDCRLRTMQLLCSAREAAAFGHGTECAQLL